MKTPFLNTIRNSVKQWYLPLIVGVLFIIMSVIVLSSPASSLLALSLLFALSFLFGGLMEIIFSIVNRKELDNWGWSLVFGIITFILGFSLVLYPGLSVSVLTLYIGFLFLFRSIASISFAIDVKKFGIRNWGWLLAFGILGAIASLILIWNPGLAGLTAVVLAASSFLFAGLFNISYSFQLRKLHKASKKVSAKLKHRYDKLMEDIQLEQEN